MKKTTLLTRFLQETRSALVASCFIIAFAMAQSLSAQTTYTVSTTNGSIDAPTTWSSGALPIAGDGNIWSTGALILKQTTTPITFNGGTLQIASGGMLNMIAGSSILNLNNLTLNGGTIATASGVNISFNLQSKTLMLNSGTIKTLSTGGTSGTRGILFQNCALAGSGTISIAQYNSGTIENFVEFQSTVSTAGFIGKFVVVPGLYVATPVSPSVNNGAGGILKISAPTSGTFGVSVPAANTSAGVVSNGVTYKSNLNGKLFFNAGAGNTVTLISLNLGGAEIAPGTYGLVAETGITAFTAAELTYLDSRSTGSVTVTGAINSPTSVVATNANGIASVDFVGNGATFSVTPYDVTTSTAGAPVTGLSSPILVPGLINGDSYTFTVTASNAFKTSAPSAATAPIVINVPGTITAIAAANIDAATAWPAENPVPVIGDANVWSTGAFKLTVATSPYMFNGATLNVAGAGGTLALSGANFNLNNLMLNGGIVYTGSGVIVTADLLNKTFTLNSGSIKTVSNGGINRNLLFQNASLAGTGTITISQLNAGTFENYVELLSSVNTAGFSGKFEVAPGLSGLAAGGTLKLNTNYSSTFGVTVKESDATNGITSNVTKYLSTLNGKLYFTGSIMLTSLNLGGTEIAYGTYTYADFANYEGVNLQGYLNSASTGTITVATAGTQGINQVVQNNEVLVTVKDKSIQIRNNAASIEVYNLVGKCMINRRNVAASTSFAIPTNGVYLVKAKTERGVFTQKIIMK